MFAVLIVQLYNLVWQPHTCTISLGFTVSSCITMYYAHTCTLIGLHDGIILLPLPECFSYFLLLVN
jgi:hypothetical protein